VLGRIASTAGFTVIMPGLAMVYLPVLVLSANGGPRDPGALRFAGLAAIVVGLALLLVLRRIHRPG